MISLMVFSEKVLCQRSNDNIFNEPSQPSRSNVLDERGGLTIDPSNSSPSFSSPSEGVGSGESLSTQDDPGFGEGGNGDPTQDNNNVPIDGGLSVLLAMGLGKGAKTYLKYRRNTKA
ncbi:MAG: hypothetical protein ACOVNY_12035 [Chitinophagaceae bacterium]